MNFEAYIPSDITKYLDGFNRRKYAGLCESYLAGCKGFFAELEQCEDVEAVAKELVEWMDSRVTGIFKGRKHCDFQYFLLSYAAPAAVEQNTEKALAFAEATKNAWMARHPNMPYECVSMEQLSKGFSNSILGINLGTR